MKKCLHYIYIFAIAFIFISNLFVIKVNSQTLLKGGISAVIEKGKIIELNLSTPLNFYFSQEGDKVAGFINEDILIGDGSYIPKGSRIEGTITGVKAPQNFGRDGAFEIEFNELITPLGDRLPLFAAVSTDTVKSYKKIADILSYDSALVAYGSVNGFIGGIQYGGIPLAIGSHGISLLASTGVGAGAGVIGSVRRKGKIPVIANNINIPIVLKSDLYFFSDLPKTVNAKKSGETEYKGFRFFPAVKKEEIDLSINQILHEHSKLYGGYILLKFTIKNNSRNPISLSNFVLLNKSKNEQLHPDLLLSGIESLKQINSMDEYNASLAFLISDKIDKYTLVLLDSLDRSEVASVPLKKKD